MEGRERLYPSPPHPLGSLHGDGVWCHLAELGFDVIHEDVDFFSDLGECVVTNPPFSELPESSRACVSWATFRRDHAVFDADHALLRDLFPDIQ